MIAVKKTEFFLTKLNCYKTELFLCMKSKEYIETQQFIKMLESENRAEYARYKYETQSSLSQICDNSDALGPLVLKEKIGLSVLCLAGDISYSRFRPGDRVELRIKKINADISDFLCDDWRVLQVKYPAPGKIEILIEGAKPIDLDKLKEVFLFKSSSTKFNYGLIRRITDITNANEASIIGTQNYRLSTSDHNFVSLYKNLNPSQQNAINHLISNNLSGAIQGPPGTGKTQLLKAVIELALRSNMKVAIASFTNAAVDNLIARVVDSNFQYEWYRVGDPDKVRKELYSQDVQAENFISDKFKKSVIDANLIGATLHKIAFNKSAPKVDLLVIDEAGQVPIYFWPFIEQIARRVILVGDQFQLPPVLASKHANLPFDNIFSSVIDSDSPMLETQYRMRREIQAWSSEKFYKGKLQPHDSVAERDFFFANPTFYTDGFVVAKKFNSGKLDKSSQVEANFISDKIESLIKNETNISSVGVICPYRAQAGIINATLQNRLGVEMASKVLIDTVERFQGQEKEAIFLSFGNSIATQQDLDFLSDPKRLNVSITRAKSRFYCLFDNNLWQNSKKAEDLNEFLNWVADGKTSIRRAA